MPSPGFGDISTIDSKLVVDGFRSGPRGDKRELQARSGAVWVAFHVS